MLAGDQSAWSALSECQAQGDHGTAMPIEGMHLTCACMVIRMAFPNPEGARTSENLDLGGKGRPAAGKCRALSSQRISGVAAEQSVVAIIR